MYVAIVRVEDAKGPKLSPAVALIAGMYPETYQRTFLTTRWS
jgi:hypothetical protein